MTKDEAVGWDHQLNGHEFEETPDGVSSPFGEVKVKMVKVRW